MSIEQKKFNSGVAYDIRLKYRYAYTQYMAYCRNKDKEDLLGQCQVVRIKNSLHPKYIANMFAQENYGYDGKCYTNYIAFETCIKHLKAYMNLMEIETVAMPYKIGCGRGGGDWDIIYKILCKYFGNDNNIKSILYDIN